MEEEQPKVGPKGEGVGTTESKHTENTERRRQTFAGEEAQKRSDFGMKKGSLEHFLKSGGSDKTIRCDSLHFIFLCALRVLRG